MLAHGDSPGDLIRADRWTNVDGLNEENGKEQVLWNVRRRRRRVPDRTQRSTRVKRQRLHWQRLEDRHADERGDGCAARSRIAPGGSRAAVIRGSLRHDRRGAHDGSMLERTCAALATLASCFRRRLPSGALRERALQKAKHTDESRGAPHEGAHALSMRCAGQTVKRGRRILTGCVTSSHSWSR